MSKFKKTPFKPWETKNADGMERRFIRMGNTQMCSERMRKLSSIAFKIYCYMKLESGGSKQFAFPHNKYASYVTKPTFFRALRNLSRMALSTLYRGMETSEGLMYMLFQNGGKRFKKAIHGYI